MCNAGHSIFCGYSFLWQPTQPPPSSIHFTHDTKVNLLLLYKFITFQVSLYLHFISALYQFLLHLFVSIIRVNMGFCLNLCTQFWTDFKQTQNQPCADVFPSFYKMITIYKLKENYRHIGKWQNSELQYAELWFRTKIIRNFQNCLVAKE